MVAVHVPRGLTPRVPPHSCNPERIRCALVEGIAEFRPYNKRPPGLHFWPGRSFILSQALRADHDVPGAPELTVWSYFFLAFFVAFFVAFLVAFFFAAFFAIVIYPFICVCD